MNSAATEFDGKNKYIRITDISESSNKFVPNPLTSPEGELDEKFKLKEGDIVFARTGASTGKTYIYNADDGELYFAGFLIKFHIDKANPKFVFYNTLKDEYFNWVGVMSVRSGQPGINSNEYKKLPINLPSFNEQQKISSFLESIDAKIDLLKKKHEYYNDFKKYLMQQIFAQKLRFKNFDDEWVQVKLKDIVERVKRKNTDLNSNLVLTISAEHGLINQEEFFNKIVASKSLKDYYLIKNGEFAYNKSYSHGYPYGAIKRLDNYSQGVLSSLYICFKPTKVNSDFLKEYFETNFWHKEIYSIAVEGARNHGLLNININDFFNTKHYIPPSYEEQEEIAKFFKMFSLKINSINNELDLAKNFKKGLLQQMFIYFYIYSKILKYHNLIQRYKTFFRCVFLYFFHNTFFISIFFYNETKNIH